MSTALSAALKVWQPGDGLSCPELLRLYSTAHPDLKKQSLEQYQVAINLIMEWGGRNLAIEEIFSLSGLEQFVKWLIDTPKSRGSGPGKQRSLRTVKGKRDAVLTLWEFAVDRDLIFTPVPPRRKLARLKAPRRDPEAWFPEEMRRIIESAKNAPRFGHCTSNHWVTFLAAMYQSSERRSALLCARFCDLAADNSLLIDGQFTKDKKAHKHELTAELANAIRALQTLTVNIPEPQAGLIWPFPGCEETIRNRYRHILRSAGLPFDGRHLFHCIRRTSLTETKNAAGLEAAKEKASHVTPMTTLASYISQRTSIHRSTVCLLPDPLR